MEFPAETCRRVVGGELLGSSRNYQTREGEDGCGGQDAAEVPDASAAFVLFQLDLLPHGTRRLRFCIGYGERHCVFFICIGPFLVFLHPGGYWTPGHQGQGWQTEVWAVFS